ncbi:MAG: isoprenylcysteine carboxylmethyltransferase family protein [Anaerolineae bacterium]|nr:isoprenylcysteine carboxylmethyltransferase family protein [Anaerolineae bacterium]
MEPERTGQKMMEDRDDLTGEHDGGDAGQAAFALLFCVVWVADSFFLHLTTQLTLRVPSWVRGPFAILLLGLSITCAWSGLMIVFGEVRETPVVIRSGIFGVVRHPVYLSEVLLYAALSLFTMSLASCVVGLAASLFLYYLSRYEEKLLLKRFGEEYRAYMREVGMWFPRRRL